MKVNDLILRRLLYNPGAFVSGALLADNLNISRTSIWKSMKKLRDEGYDIEARKGKGYKLNRLSDLPLEREIIRDLKTNGLWKNILYEHSVDSTNRIAKNLARNKSVEGTVIIAGTQTQGRGRLGRTWISRPGGIYLSIILRPNLSPSSLTGLTLISGLAFSRSIRKLLNIELLLKWPNDLICNDKKLGGILTEMEGDAEEVHFVVIGLGVNVNNDISLCLPATSLKRIIGKDIRLNLVIKSFLEEFENLYTNFSSDPTNFIEEYRGVSSTIGKRIVLNQLGKEIIGKALDVDPDGGLLIELENGSIKKFYSGEVTSTSE